MNKGLVILIFTALSILKAQAQAPNVLILRPEKAQPSKATNASPLRGFQEAALFRNGDVLAGTLMGIRSNQVVWKHPDAKEAVELSIGSLAELQIKAETKSHSDSTNACMVRLTNGDQIEAELVGLDGEQLNLRTWYAGDITLARNLVQAITPTGPSRSTVFEGPAGLDGWVLGRATQALPNSGRWIYRNGAFYASKAASIAHDVHLPDVSTFSFDLTWKGYFQMAIALYSDSLQPVSLANKETEPDFGGFYSLQLNTFAANLLPITKNDPIRYLGQASLLTFSQKNHAHVDIRTSKPRHSITLLVNGELVREWIDPAEFAGKGTAVRFVHQGQGAVKIENIKVAEWDGLFEDKEVAPPPLRNDLAKLRNGDRVGGTLQTIRDGTVTISTGDRKLDIPFTRAKEIALAREKSTLPPALPVDVRGFFARGGFVTLQIENWDGDGFIASSPAFGKAKFNARTFTRLEFIPGPKGN